MTPNQFELHAGGRNRHPPEYIYLDNGSTLRDVLSACKNALPDSLEATIQMATAGLPGKNPSFCLYCKGSTSLYSLFLKATLLHRPPFLYRIDAIFFDAS